MVSVYDYYYKKELRVVADNWIILLRMDTFIEPIREGMRKIFKVAMQKYHEWLNESIFHNIKGTRNGHFLREKKKNILQNIENKNSFHWNSNHRFMSCGCH